MNRTKQALKYIIADYLTATIAWFGFFIFRKTYIEPLKFGQKIALEFSDKFYYGLAFLPLVWVLYYAILGTYHNPYRKSRLKEFGQTFLHSILGVVIIFFVLILDDEIANYKSYYLSLFSLLILHFTLTVIVRIVITTATARKIHRGEIGFKTLVIGSNEKALELYNDLNNQPISSGFKLLGFVHVNGGDGHMLKGKLPHLGHSSNLIEIIENQQIEEVIIAPESSEHSSVNKIINQLQGRDLYIKVIPDMYDILSGSVKMTSIFGAPLVDIKHETMPEWQQSLKRMLDVFIASLVLLVGSPFYLIVGILVKTTSKGPAFYFQKRIGKNGKPFTIIKFRSMYIDSEKGTPMLSSDDDPRITPFGKFMRKTRIDEFPQFYNVLIGEMSMVGPRPERQFFIDQIMEKAPHYVHLNKVRPGITSWGQVKYGYAETVEEMIERLKYDILYVENQSLFLDIKILIYTVLIVLQGRGK